jgi:hypothetical protein
MNEITVRPLVDILSEQLGKQVVMSGDDYVYLSSLEVVPSASVLEAIVIQNKVDVPTLVTMRQARLALLQSGLLTTVTEAITASTDEALKIEWEYATEVRRDWTSLIALTEELGMASEQLDDLFILANTL